MKILDWENKVKSKFRFDKTENKDDLKSLIIGYEQNVPHFYVALKKNNFEFYLKSIDNVCYSGVEIFNDDKSVNLINLIGEYLSKKQYAGAILLEDLIDYFIGQDFNVLSYDELDDNQKRIVKNKSEFKVSFVSENEVPDDEFYALYIFQEDEGLNVKPRNTGFSKTFVILGSKDRKNISSYYVMTNGMLNQEDMNKFLDVVNISEMNSIKG